MEKDKIKKLKYLVLWCSNRCNLSCVYCYAKNNLGNEDMSFLTAKKAIDILDENGTLILAGGEPLMNFPLIKDIFSYIEEKKYKFKVGMQSNGTLINKEIAKELKKLNLGIGISFDGKPEINNSLRSNAKEVIRGIEYLKEEKINININAVISKYNVFQLSGLVDLAYYFDNVKAIGFDLLRGNEGLRASYSMVYEGVKKAYERSELLNSLTGKKVFIREIEDAKIRIMNSYKACNYCYASMGQAAVVIPNGDMYLCSSLVSKEEYYLGNILDRYSFKSLKDLEFKECKKCNYYKMCRKICPSREILNEINGKISREECALRKVCFDIVMKKIK
ncbi:radical SAM protein [Haloimpatiens sp. FM7315]|uniref:radical SAM protein n=1 Tax=Haloimpatiens sp. FM7315 TaxID=3298609 RepID=UPI00370B7947